MSAHPCEAKAAELAQQAVVFVKNSVGVELDYQAETLPVLDHYLGEVPKDRPEIVRLSAHLAGVYFGMVIERVLGGVWEWEKDDGPEEWEIALGGVVRFSPVGMAAEAIAQADLESPSGTVHIAPEHKAFVSEALAARPEVPEDEYYSLSGRLELFYSILDLISQHKEQLASKN